MPLGAAGRNVTSGANVVLRNPHEIRIGSNAAIEDACRRDAEGVDNRGASDDGSVKSPNTTSIPATDSLRRSSRVAGTRQFADFVAKAPRPSGAF